MVNINQYTKYLGQRSFSSKDTDTQTHTHQTYCCTWISRVKCLVTCVDMSLVNIFIKVNSSEDIVCYFASGRGAKYCDEYGLFVCLSVCLLAQPIKPHGRTSPIFTARCTTAQSAVLRSHVVCLSVCDVGGSGPHMLKILETNYANN